MKVTAFNGSPRPDGNTALLIGHVLQSLKEEGIETEVVQVGGGRIHGCIACYKCFGAKDGRCAVDDDPVNNYIEKMRASDGIIIGSPTYFAAMTPETKALIDRCGMVSRANGDMFKRKAGAAVVAVRRAGAIHVFDGINHFFTIGQMIIPGSNYWNIGVGRNIGDVEQDEEGIKTMRELGVNMAWLLKRIKD
ncbi:flavodoxin family protein [Geobacter sp. SVR]|uniref:flavodoxin family protein n=1 Tax=Geobacter sp. SVR TaxID=2495594 RepID=UPI00143EFEFA|nr:flavodoxin family protein [Geobacter sp. SVR]BCS55286.1 flavodoxin family protein [Geobacter sp. SVR]GCF86085.1 flavodoxin family protein [Geobacter sp. SVR]